MSSVIFPTSSVFIPALLTLRSAGLSHWINKRVLAPFTSIQYSEKQAPTTPTAQNNSYMFWINMLAILQVLTMNATWDNRPCLLEK